jgi:maleylpyruvate isomerase
VRNPRRTLDGTGHHVCGESALTAPAERARRGIAATRVATDAVIIAVNKLDDAAVRRPSLLPGWTRAHVITHLARNADALLNLLIWARTGVEHPAYTSRADRDADIEKGSTRCYLLLVEDLSAACDRFARAADAMPDSAWSAGLTTMRGSALLAAQVPWMRVREVWVHLVDLDTGIGFNAVPDDVVEDLLDDVVRQFHGRPGVPAMTVEATLPDGRRRRWQIGGGDAVSSVSGAGLNLLAWLTGRGDGVGLSGALPALPPWG